MKMVMMILASALLLQQGASKTNSLRRRLPDIADMRLFYVGQNWSYESSESEAEAKVEEVKPKQDKPVRRSGVDIDDIHACGYASQFTTDEQKKDMENRYKLKNGILIEFERLTKTSGDRKRVYGIRSKLKDRNGNAVGMIEFEIKGDLGGSVTLFVNHLEVVPKYRGLGIFKIFIATAVHYAKREGLHLDEIRLIAGQQPGECPPHVYYAKIGFQVAPKCVDDKLYTAFGIKEHVNRAWIAPKLTEWFKAGMPANVENLENKFVTDLMRARSTRYKHNVKNGWLTNGKNTKWWADSEHSDNVGFTLDLRTPPTWLTKKLALLKNAPEKLELVEHSWINRPPKALTRSISCNSVFQAKKSKQSSGARLKASEAAGSQRRATK